MWWTDSMFDADPFSAMRRLQYDMNRLFDGYGSAREPYPAVNVWRNEENVVVTAEVPGMDPKSIDVAVEGDQLSIQGERKAEDLEPEVVCLRTERGVGRFARSFRLPYEVDSGKVSAKYSNGVLTVTLPRSESAKPRKIQISAS